MRDEILAMRAPGRWGLGVGFATLLLALLAGWYAPSPAGRPAAMASTPLAPSATTLPSAAPPPGPTPSPTATGTATPVPSATPFTTPTAAPATYIVQPGDTLYGIADKVGVAAQAIVDANELSDPDRLSEGQRLLIPTPTDRQ